MAKDIVLADRRYPTVEQSPHPSPGTEPPASWDYAWSDQLGAHGSGERPKVLIALSPALGGLVPLPHTVWSGHAEGRTLGEGGHARDGG